MAVAETKGKYFRFIAESGGAVVAQQNGLVAEEEEIEIVVMIEIEPDGFGVVAIGDGYGRLFEPAFAIDPEFGAGFGDYGEVGQAVVIEIAGRDRNYIFQIAQTGIQRSGGTVFEDFDSGAGPGDEFGIAVAIHVGRSKTRAAGVESSGQLSGIEFDCGGGLGCRRRFFSRGIGYIVDFGVETPLEVFGNGGARLASFDGEERGLFTSGIVGAASGPVRVGELEVRAREIGIELRRQFEFFYRLIRFVGELVERAQVVVSYRLIGNQASPCPEIGRWLCRTGNPSYRRWRD